MATLDDLINQRQAAQAGRWATDNNYAMEGAGQGRARMQQAVDQFNSLFKNFVGRAPGQAEMDQFINGILSDPQWLQVGAHESRAMADLRDPTTQFISDTFQRTAEDQARQELEGQQGEAMRLSELFRTQGRTSISELEKSLLDFQSRLMERLRPQMITSLQTQGLLNTGALPESLAGAAQDLSDEATMELMNKRFQNEQAANEIAFSGAAAPLEFSRANAMGRTANLAGAGTSALERAYQQRMNELAMNNQLRLADLQGRNRNPSLLKQMGGYMLGNLMSTFIPGAGNIAARSMMAKGGGGGGMPLPLSPYSASAGVAS